VVGEERLRTAIASVVHSFQGGDTDQILIQPMLCHVSMSGVAFSRDPNTGSAYFVINYDDRLGDTTAVTGGRVGDLKTYVHSRHSTATPPCELADVVDLVAELEKRFECDSIDVEFARDSGGQLYLLQVRRLQIKRPTPDGKQHEALLEAIADKIAAGMRRHPHLHGPRTVYGVMPDWNPAEIIGIRPRPLALSLYRDLITDSIWAYQRNNYGYKNLRSFPLLVHFFGLPYIDVRVSFNSFVPRDIETDLADKLVAHYIDKLLSSPALHDKVEFDIVFSCYTPDLDSRLGELAGRGFKKSEIKTLEESLRRLTNRIIHKETGLWREDAKRLETLNERHERILNADIDDVGRIYWLLEDCKRYGTLPFAGLARAGFIAVQMLKSLVHVNVLSDDDYGAFMSGLSTVSSQMKRDLAGLRKSDFLARYGHLRPGTYDILSPRYDEAPDLYFNWENTQKDDPSEPRPFALSLKQMQRIEQLLTEHQLAHDVIGLFDFIKSAIELREYSKFLFTRNLSDALSLYRRFGERLGFSADELSFGDIGLIREMNAASVHAKDALRECIAKGKDMYGRTQQITLPPLITKPEDVWSFFVPPSQPNFISQKTITGPVRSHCEKGDLAGSIVAIENADPGFDWIFSHRILGFVTAYGGANSHMAIRANELGLPAVIGAGESLYRRWASAQVLQIDCAGRLVSVLR
jgi:hypothetical protein